MLSQTIFSMEYSYDTLFGTQGTSNCIQRKTTVRKPSACLQLEKMFITLLCQKWSQRSISSIPVYLNPVGSCFMRVMTDPMDMPTSSRPDLRIPSCCVDKGDLQMWSSGGCCTGRESGMIQRSPGHHKGERRRQAGGPEPAGQQRCCDNRHGAQGHVQKPWDASGLCELER